MSRTRREQGFTLIELLLYVGLLLLIVAAVGALLLGAVQSHAKARVMRDVMHNTSVVRDAVALEVKDASRVYTPTTSSTQLSLATSKNPPTGETTTFVDFFVCDTRLCIKREGQSPVALTSLSVEVRAFDVQIISTGSIASVQMTLTMGSLNPNTRDELESEIQTTSVISLRTYE